MPTTPSNLAPVVAVGALLAFRMYFRVRRNIGRQPLQRKRSIARVIIFAVLTCALGLDCLFHPHLWMGLGGGLALGVVLALVGLRLTRFEATPEGHFYTPNPYIGVGLSVLLVGRVAYRLFLISNASGASLQAPPLMQSALSFLVFELIAGYYMVYYIGLLRKSNAPSAN